MSLEQPAPYRVQPDDQDSVVRLLHAQLRDITIRLEELEATVGNTRVRVATAPSRGRGRTHHRAAREAGWQPR